VRLSCSPASTAPLLGLLACAVIASILGCADQPTSQQRAQATRTQLPASDQRCIPRFPFQSGWWGADGAYSIPLADGRDLWIFGDTLYGDTRTMKGSDLQMVRNSVGISACKDGKWTISYVLRRTPTGKPLDFFQARNREYWYWALDGFYVDARLYVTLLCVRSTAKTNENPFEFETCGADLARLSELQTDPQDWVVEYFPLAISKEHAYPAASAVVSGKYAYIFALKEVGVAARPLLLTRIPLARLGSPLEALEYYSRDGQWKPGLVPDDAAAVIENGVSELSVRYHPQQKEWVAVQFDPKAPGTILVRTAPQITGPWSAGNQIYRVPELSTQEGHPDRFCYAAKEHLELGDANAMLVTYVCNSMVPKYLLKQLDIYVPKALLLPVPRTP
jgi:hypothetical protein